MKVAILTHYYHSHNYGGLLQAYALCKTIELMGHQVEQISYDRTTNRRRIRSLIRKYIDFCKNPRSLLITKQMIKRNDALEEFGETIPHSSAYTDETLENAIDEYDAFIVGSDQVWHPKVLCRGYLLSFVPKNKIKLSYGASIAKNDLSAEDLQIFKEAFADYQAISVREENAISLLQPVSPVPIEWVLDPTLLLSKIEWNKLCDSVAIDSPYVLCYFLGDDTKQRDLAIEYAAVHKLKVVSFPHLLGQYRKCDATYGDIQLYDVNPKQFLALIRDASCVFTDSYHAMVFSGIFSKQYFVFNRTGYGSMESRIISLGKLLGSEERFCDTSEKQSIQYINSLSDNNTKHTLDALEMMKSKSVQFLTRNLGQRKYV